MNAENAKPWHAMSDAERAEALTDSAAKALYTDGKDAAKNGKSYSHAPFPWDDPRREKWAAGWWDRWLLANGASHADLHCPAWAAA
jgi:hypothetical protein